MPDGPLKNLNLGSRWKRFVGASHNDAFDSTERCALASDALLRDILTDDLQALLTDLRTHERQPQLDLEPLSSVESVFRRHRKTAFGDILQKEVSFRLCDRMTLSTAVRQALEASVDDQISKARNRVQEECIRARESEEMRQDEYDRTVTLASAAFDAMANDEFCDALLAGDKNAFENGSSKKTGLDEGPRL